MAGLSAAVPARAAEKKKAVLKLCSQEWLVPGGSLKEKAEKILQWGGCGLEFGGLDVKRAEQIKKELEGTGIGLAALCWGSLNGDLVSTDLAKRKKGLATLKGVLQAAGVLGSTGVIWVPAFNGQSTLSPAELDKIMDQVLPEMADLAREAHSRILIEPLNKGETFYINRIEQAAAFCKKLNHPGLCLMGDFYHMSKEEKDDGEAFVTGAPGCTMCTWRPARIAFCPARSRTVTSRAFRASSGSAIRTFAVWSVASSPRRRR